MIRTIQINLDVGDTAPDACGQCPFRTLDWDGGEPKGREFCSCPSWDMHEVTGGVRHRECLDAEVRVPRELPGFIGPDGREYTVGDALGLRRMK